MSKRTQEVKAAAASAARRTASQGSSFGEAGAGGGAGGGSFAALLRSLGLDKFEPVFADLGVEEASDLELLEDADLKEAGLTRVQLIKLKKAV